VNPDPSTAEPPHIKIASHVVIQLGQELVTDVEQAFLELAKNAYDADSDDCQITIDPKWAVPAGDPLYRLISPQIIKKAPKNAKGLPCVGRVLIKDSGLGATAGGVLDGWLTISGSPKRALKGAKEVTEKGRTPVGDKGLGRLATMKIGDLLLFRTAREGERRQRVTCFSWGEFERVKTINQVTVEQWTEARDPPYEQGSTIEVVGLHDRDRWSADGMTNLIGRLSSLVNPYVGFKDFEITVQTPGKDPQELTKIGSDTLNFSSAEFHFVWDGKTLKKTALISRSLFRGTTGDKEKEKFQLIFSDEHIEGFRKRLANNNTLKKLKPDLEHAGKGIFATFEELDDVLVGRKKPVSGESCGPFKGDIRYFMFNEEFHNRVQGNSSSVEQVQSMSGVMIFRDGFRVRADDDWLGLSRGTTSGSFYNLRPRNTLGYFAVSNAKNPGLIEKSDREGFVENDVLKEFLYIAGECRDFANIVIKVCRNEANLYYGAINLDIPGVATPSQARAKLNATRKHAETQLSKVEDQTARAMGRITKVRSTLDDGTTSREIDNALKNFGEAAVGISQIRTRMEELDRTSVAIEEFRRAESDRNIRLVESAAVGLSARILAHEARTYLDLIDGAVSKLSRPLRKMQDDGASEALHDLILNIREIRKLISAINPVLPGSKSLRDKLTLGKAISSYLAERQSTIISRGVSLKITGEDSQLQFKFNRVRFNQILENLLQNSLYWIEEGPAAGAKREIHIQLQGRGFRWWDTGPGIVDRHEDDLFEAYISGKRGAEGKGLGLYIISTYLEAERCQIALLSDRNRLGKRFKFEIDLSGAVMGRD
jgi:signal transduction histidine kinase